MDLIDEIVDLMNAASLEELYIFLDEVNKEIQSREEEEQWEEKHLPILSMKNGLHLDSSLSYAQIYV